MATALTDLFPHRLRRPGRRELLTLVIAVVCFLLGLPLITEVTSQRGIGTMRSFEFSVIVHDNKVRFSSCLIPLFGDSQHAEVLSKKANMDEHIPVKDEKISMLSFSFELLHSLKQLLLRR